MLTPEQVVPFLQHDDPIVRRHAVRYFDNSFDWGPLTAEHYWALIDRFGENDETLSVAADLPPMPQTDASVRRLLQAIESNPSDNFEYHYQRGARDMQFDVLERNAALLLGCGKLLPHVREHLETRLRLRDEPPEAAWERLIERGRELGDAYAGSFPQDEIDGWIEAAARGGATVGERAIAILANEEAQMDWRAIFAAKVLGRARFEPAIDVLVEQFGFDTDLLREEAQRALARICTPRVVESVLAFYPGKQWHVRLYAGDPLEHIKHPASEAGLLKLVEVERAMEADPDPDDPEGEPLTLSLLIGLTGLCSMAGLEESRQEIKVNRGNPELMGLYEGLLATALMSGVSLPEERTWRKQIEYHDRRAARARAKFDGLFASVRENWRKSGIETFPSRDGEDSDQEALTESASSLPAVLPSRSDEVPVPIRNTAPKVGRNDPCPCGSGKKFKKCCGNK